MIRTYFKNLLFWFFTIALGFTAEANAASAFKLVQMKSAELPITVFNITFRTGSADDPRGQEGLANLTARLVREGGVQKWQMMPARTRAELEDYLFPFAADISVSVAKEQTSFEVTCAASDAEAVFNTLAQVLLAPSFDQEEFSRLKAEALDALKKQLPREDQEELGKAALDQAIFGSHHPYAHVIAGTVAAVSGLDVAKVKQFYKEFFTQKRLTVGVAGVVSHKLVNRIQAVFSALPLGENDRAHIALVDLSNEMHLTIVKGPFDATGVHLGQPLPINRASPQFGRLYLASMAFGKHRSFVGRLMHVVREVRGLNYGTYSYVEDFPHGGAFLSEPTQVARTQQAFTVWARPATPVNGCFLLRQVYREVTELSNKGLTKDEFELGKSHLIGNAPLLATGLERRLGYAIDSGFYGIKGDYLMGLQKQARQAELSSTNALLKKLLHPAKMQIVVVTAEPEKFKEQILGESCPIQYGNGVEKPKDVLAEDKVISTYSLKAAGLKPENIRVVDSESIF